MMKKISLTAIVGLSLLLGFLVFFSAEPILDDPSKCFVVKVSLNDAFEEGGDTTVELTEFDEAAILNCLAKYEEHRIFERCTGWAQRNVEITLYIGTENGLKMILLGKEMISCGPNDDFKHEIINGDQLREELRAFITSTSPG